VSGGGADDASKDLAIQTIVGMIVGGASLVGPDAGAAATASAPSLAALLRRLSSVLRSRRSANAEEVLVEAIDAASIPAEEFIVRAMSDDSHSELLVRALTSAQDTALREKRRALGRALADGVCGDSDVNDELLFIRAVADLDAPHIVVLKTTGLDPPAIRPFPRAWTYDAILERLPALADTLMAILLTLELHTLISKMQLTTGSGQAAVALYNILPRGRLFLSRLEENVS
jgi:hypothetical protein